MESKSGAMGAFAVVYVVSVLVAFIWGGAVATDVSHERAIQVGAAFYDCDPLTGDCEFAWRHPND